VEAALNGRTGEDRRVSTSTNRPELKIAIPAWPGVVRVSAPLEQVDARFARRSKPSSSRPWSRSSSARRWPVWAGRALARPLAELGHAARALAAGEQPVFPDSATAEVRQLVRSLRTMNDELAARMDALRRGERKPRP